MDTIKIKKLQEGVFKHVVNDDEDQSFYSTNYVKLSIDNGTIAINSGTFNRDFYLSGIELYDINSSKPLVVTDMDDFVKKLAGLGYPFLGSNNSNNKITNDYTSISIVGRIRDLTQDVVQTYGDGTTQTLYYTTEGEFAGRSKRE